MHSAREGKKIDLIRTQGKISFEMDCCHELIGSGESACRFGYKYQSVMGKGIISLVEDTNEKMNAFHYIMEHYTGKRDWIYDSNMIKHTEIIRLDVNEWTCKVCE